MNIQIFDTNKLTMSSLEIAELTGKEHRNVMADIRKMFEELGQAAADFSATAFYQVNNATCEREVFNIPSSRDITKMAVDALKIVLICQSAKA